MKEQYRAYMDQVEVSPALHQRLIGLSAPRRPNRWRRYGSLAAVLVVLIGVGAVGLGRLAGERAGAELGETEPDIALEENPQEGAGEAGTIGGYEVTDGEVVSYFALPYIAYGPAPADSTQVDYTLTAPAGSTRRAVTAVDVLTLVGGETALETHLGWGGTGLDRGGDLPQRRLPVAPIPAGGGDGSGPLPGGDGRRGIAAQLHCD